MNQQINIGFIGFGNMAQAITKGLIETGGYDCRRIFACAGSFEKLQKNAEQFGIRAVETASELIENCNFIVIAVKPGMIESVITPVRGLLEKKAIISVAAGYDFDEYEKILAPGTHHISTIPNTPISVGAGILVCEKKHSLSEEEFECFTAIFSQIALIEMVETSQLSIGGTISGCTPAFTAMYLEALSDAGVKHGLSRDTAYRMAAQMLRGTGTLYLESKEHPGTLKDAVCSPGGTTVRGVVSLEKNAFRGIVIEAIDTIEE